MGMHDDYMDRMDDSYRLMDRCITRMHYEPAMICKTVECESAVTDVMIAKMEAAYQREREDMEAYL